MLKTLHQCVLEPAPLTGLRVAFFFGRAMNRDGAVRLNSLSIASCIIPRRQLSKKPSTNEPNSSKLKKKMRGKQQY